MEDKDSMTKKKVFLPILICAMLLAFVLGVFFVFSGDVKTVQAENEFSALDENWTQYTGSGDTWLESTDQRSISHTSTEPLTDGVNMLWSTTTYSSGINSFSVSAKVSDSGAAAWGMLLEFSSSNFIIAWVEWEVPTTGTYANKFIFSKVAVVEMTGDTYTLKPDFWTDQSWFTSNFNSDRTLDPTVEHNFHCNKSGSSYTFYLDGVTVGTISDFTNGSSAITKIGLIANSTAGKTVTFTNAAPKKNVTSLSKSWDIHPTWSSSSSNITSTTNDSTPLSSPNSFAITKPTVGGTQYSTSVTASSDTTTARTAYAVVPFIKDSSNFVITWVEFDELPETGDGWLTDYGIIKFGFNVYVDGVLVTPYLEQTHWTDSYSWFNGTWDGGTWNGSITSAQLQEIQKYKPNTARTLRVDRKDGKYIVYYNDFKLFEYTITQFASDAPSFVGVAAAGNAVVFSGMAETKTHTLTKQVNGENIGTEEVLTGTSLSLNDIYARGDFNSTTNAFAWRIGSSSYSYQNMNTTYKITSNQTISVLAFSGTMENPECYAESDFSRIRLKYKTTFSDAQYQALKNIGATFTFKTTMAMTSSYGGTYTYDKIVGSGKHYVTINGLDSNGNLPGTGYFYGEFKMLNYEIATTMTAVATISVNIGGTTHNFDPGYKTKSAYAIIKGFSSSVANYSEYQALLGSIYNKTGDTGYIDLASLDDFNALYIDGVRIAINDGGLQYYSALYDVWYEDSKLNWEKK